MRYRGTITFVDTLAGILVSQPAHAKALPGSAIHFSLDQNYVVAE